MCSLKFKFTCTCTCNRQNIFTKYRCKCKIIIYPFYRCFTWSSYPLYYTTKYLHVLVPVTALYDSEHKPSPDGSRNKSMWKWSCKHTRIRTPHYMCEVGTLRVYVDATQKTAQHWDCGGQWRCNDLAEACCCEYVRTLGGRRPGLSVSVSPSRRLQASSVACSSRSTSTASWKQLLRCTCQSLPEHVTVSVSTCDSQRLNICKHLSKL